jgi:CspA family cold shock protein
MSNCKDTQTSEIFIGRVKWFNNKTGFGFISITDGGRNGEDIFVHHSNINVLSEQYKYLVQGEYVEFNITSTKEGKHKIQANNVKGIKSGQLMCETRRDFREARNNYKNLEPKSLNEKKI